MPKDFRPDQSRATKRSVHSRNVTEAPKTVKAGRKRKKAVSKVSALINLQAHQFEVTRKFFSQLRGTQKKNAKARSRPQPLAVLESFCVLAGVELPEPVSKNSKLSTEIRLVDPVQVQSVANLHSWNSKCAFKNARVLKSSGTVHFLIPPLTLTHHGTKRSELIDSVSSTALLTSQGVLNYFDCVTCSPNSERTITRSIARCRCSHLLVHVNVCMP